MEKQSIHDKLKGLISDRPSNWLEKAKARKANRDWMLKSAAIAAKVLRIIRANNISQTVLADQLSVSRQYISKILKGSENLTLETVTLLEKALGVELITVTPLGKSFDMLFGATFSDKILVKGSENISSFLKIGDVQTLDKKAGVREPDTTYEQSEMILIYGRAA